MKQNNPSKLSSHPVPELENQDLEPEVRYLSSTLWLKQGTRTKLAEMKAVRRAVGLAPVILSAAFFFYLQ